MGAAGSEDAGVSGGGFFRDLLKNTRQHWTMMLLIPALTFCVFCTCGLVGVTMGANEIEKDLRTVARVAGAEWASSFGMSAEKMFPPLVASAVLIQLHPQVDQVEPLFPATVKQLLDHANDQGAGIQKLLLAPMGSVRMVYPASVHDSLIGVNIFRETKFAEMALQTVAAHRLVLHGPLEVLGLGFGILARLPIYVQNSSIEETFGTGQTSPDSCGELCYNFSTREKFWGFVTAYSSMGDLRAGNDTRLKQISSRFTYMLTRPYAVNETRDTTMTSSTGDFVFANSSTWPSDTSIATEIKAADAVWKVYLEPLEGWRPSWEKGLNAAVILGSFIVAALVQALLHFHLLQRRLLQAYVASNKQLASTTAAQQADRQQLDTLLVRQYNLMTVLAEHRSDMTAVIKQGAADDLDGLTNTNSYMSSSTTAQRCSLELIEAMRRKVGVNPSTSAQDISSIETIELLGEGAFGKVYKGLWRGTVVAVKTTLLPANMSGAEKREKMAVMEAAISTSLSHPNTVQTYTYAVKHQFESIGAQLDTDDSCESDGTGSPHSPSKSLLYQPPGTHSYEIQLVLEYCDKGSLRAALDSGAFLLPSGSLNYLAVLDTAADVAKALLHLHSLDVLHGDLKCGNVLMASGDPEGRGVVAKVCDFGLSQKINLMVSHLSNIYQGTLTHMAPEVMLAGRVSKAADVYAFGITLWELYTARLAYDTTLIALLGHQVTVENVRPSFPADTPVEYKQLAERCWQAQIELRPTFAEVLTCLLGMRAADPQPTPPLHIQQQPKMALKNSPFVDNTMHNSQQGSGVNMNARSPAYVMMSLSGVDEDTDLE